MDRDRLDAVVLEKDRFEAFRTHSRERIVCLEGALWVTQDGVLRDYVLEAGESLDVAADAQIGVSALMPSRYRVCAAQSRAHRFDRISSVARGLGATLRGLA